MERSRAAALELEGDDCRVELEDGGYLRYVRGLFAPEFADQLYASLRDAITWEQATIRILGKEHLEPRLTKWVADADFVYRYSGAVRVPVPWDVDTQRIREAVEALVFGQSAGQYRGALLNYYRGGDDRISWHSDDERDLRRGAPIASVSLGAERRFLLRHKASKRSVEIVLEHGSCLVMDGTLQRFWHHSIPKQRAVRDGRINLTFRQHSNQHAVVR